MSHNDSWLLLPVVRVRSVAPPFFERPNEVHQKYVTNTHRIGFVRTIYMRLMQLRRLIFFCSLGLLVAAPTAPAQPNAKAKGVIPFHSIDGVIPGVTRYSAVRRIYGKPKEIEV